MRLGLNIYNVNVMKPPINNIVFVYLFLLMCVTFGAVRGTPEGNTAKDSTVRSGPFNDNIKSW
jgi:hypothetical protein